MTENQKDIERLGVSIAVLVGSPVTLTLTLTLLITLSLALLAPSPNRSARRLTGDAC